MKKGCMETHYNKSFHLATTLLLYIINFSSRIHPRARFIDQTCSGTYVGYMIVLGHRLP